MVSHQLDNSVGDALYNGYWYRDLHWNLHYHRGYEFVWVLSGRVRARVGEREYLLGEGDALFIIPYLFHSYETVGSSEVFIAVFAGGHVGKFVSATTGKEPTDAKFTVPEALATYLFSDMVRLPESREKNQILIKKPPLYVLKASLYAVCGEFFRVARWQKKEQNNELVFQMISYVEENFAEDITLKSVSEALSYEYHYLSRVLRTSLHMRFCTLVNQYRCERAKELITQTDKPLSEIAMNCGFQSIRSFNRAFLDIVGCTPSSIRKGKE